MKNLTLILPVLLFCSSCSSKYGIVKAKAYVRQSTAGTIKADDNGRPLSSGINTQHLIYIETDTSKPRAQWETAWVEQQAYSIEPVPVAANQIIGKTADGTEVIIDAKPGNVFWQLVLKSKKDMEPEAWLKNKINKNKIVLSGTWKDRQVVYKISKEQILQPINFQ